MLLHPFLEDAVRVEEKSVLSLKAASDCDRISVMPEYGSTILLSLGMTGGPLCGDAAFAGIVALSIMVPWSLGGCTLVAFRAGASPVCEFFQSGWN